ncbi:MAG: hypothetical protein AB7S26_41445 [Sandaracinaceae bacterium]
MAYVKHVSVEHDRPAFLDWTPLVIPSTHEQLQMGVTPIPFGPSVESTAPMCHPFGMSDHKFTSTVFHRGQKIALDGHDLGMNLDHVSLPPADVLMVLNIATSSRKAKFAVGAVKANGTPIACCTFTESIPTPMAICGTIPIPLAGTGSAISDNSLLVGMHGADALAGWVSVAITMVIDFVKATAGPLSRLDSVEAGAEQFWEKVGEELEDLLPSAPSAKDLVEDNVPDVWGALIRLGGQLWFDYQGDAELGIELVEGPFAGVEASASREAEGELEAGIEGRLGPESRNLHGEASLTRRENSEIDLDAEVEATGLGGARDRNARTRSRQPSNTHTISDHGPDGREGAGDDGAGVAAGPNWDALPSL